MIDLKTSISQTGNCGKINVIDCTGTYDAIENEQGWGVPNAESNDVTSVKVVITKGDLVYTVDLIVAAGVITGATATTPEGQVIPFVPENTVFPFDQDNPLVLPAEIFNQMEYYTDGHTTIEVIVSGEDSGGHPFEYSHYTEHFFTCRSECCVVNFGVQAIEELCDSVSTKTKKKRFIAANRLLQIMLKAKACGNTQAATSALIRLNAICTSRCGCC
jgi:hypothetical protein